MNIKEIESRFTEVTGISPDTNLSVYPLTEHVGFKIRIQEKKDNGEVFTPLELVDRMLEISKPEPNKFNMDLCAGRGQFTIRILRKFQNQSPDFDIDYYLKNFHWFNELNIDSVKKLFYIFGKDINILIGDARKIKEIKNQVYGIWIYENDQWLETTYEKINSIPIIIEQKSKKLF